VTAAPITRLVDDDGHASQRSCDGSGTAHSTIKAALAAANDQDTVLVCPGTYVGKLRVDRTGIDLVARGNQPAIILAGTRAIDALVDLGSQLPDGGDPLNNTITGFTLKARGGTSGCGRVHDMVTGHGSGVEIVDNTITVQGTPTWGPCGYDVGISVDGFCCGLIQGNTIRNWRKTGIEVAEEVVVLENELHFAHETGTTCSGAGSSGGVPYCSGATAIQLLGYESPAVLNMITPGTNFTPGGYLGSGILVKDFAENAYILSNTVERASSSLRVMQNGPALSVQIEIADNVLRYGVYGLRIQSTGSDDQLNIHDNASRLHTTWDCVDAGSAGHTWANNIGLKDSPESLCLDP
jgi:hypothetical protein